LLPTRILPGKAGKINLHGMSKALVLAERPKALADKSLVKKCMMRIQSELPPVALHVVVLNSAKLRLWGNHWSCQWKSLCVIFHSPFLLSKVNTSDARALAPANLPDQC